MILVDTNVLLYAYDRSETVKRTKAIDIIEEIEAQSIA